MLSEMGIELELVSHWESKYNHNRYGIQKYVRFVVFSITNIYSVWHFQRYFIVNVLVWASLKEEELRKFYIKNSTRMNIYG